MSRVSLISAGLVLAGLLFLGVIIGTLVRTTPIEPPPLSTEPTTPIVPAVRATSSQLDIGTSVEGRAITVHTFGTGTDNLLLVGGIHGGYEWNSILLAYETIDWLQQNPEVIPKNLTVHIIPNLNPDGLFLATGLTGRFTSADISSYTMHTSGEGRFNANAVDLNRNFDCKWQPSGTWRGRTVSAGTRPFSEPEAATLRDYVVNTSPIAAVFWHSQANTVYASECEVGILPGTRTLMNAYALAAGYSAVASFDAYPVTGDVEGWLAKIGIPAITVELKGRLTSEWNQNRPGLEAIFSALTTSSTTNAR